MQKPINLDVDFDEVVGPLGYLRYRALEPGQHVTRTQRVHDAVHADFDAQSEIVGLELLGFDDEVLAAAEHFAEQNDLEFPEMLKQRRASIRYAYAFPPGGANDVLSTSEVIKTS